VPRIRPTFIGRLASARAASRGRSLAHQLAPDDELLDLRRAVGQRQHAGVAHPLLERIEVAGVEAVRVARLGEELSRLGRIVRRRLDRQRELEAPGDDAAGQAREPERLGLVDGLPVDGVARREADAPVVPRRLRVPLVGEVEPEDAGRLGGDELQAGRALDPS
jgi:hypothetical protein